MLKMLFKVVMVVAGLAVVPTLTAQTGPTPEELTVRPADTLTWTTQAPHRLRFGGSVTHNGKPLALTPFADVQKVLEFSVAPTVDAQGVAKWPSGTPVTATVKKDAATSGVKQFFFTCGFDGHMNSMVTVSFTVAARASEPVRKVAIASGMPPKWVLKTPSGDKDLKRP